LASSEFRWRNMLWANGLDPDGFDPDVPLPDELLEGPAPTSGAERLFAAARQEKMSLRELARIHAGMPTQLTFVGSPEQLADFIDEWWRAGAVDGFTLMPTTLPDGLLAFVEHVLPILRRRGLFRAEYTGTTLREHFDLPRPPNRYEAAAHDRS
jgi:alkanesulfonate monooxygenase SsuD/methylene tetrahydromethanopterin reductase-like flavin-dependent oxidoreductase (luciferase family)